MMSLGRTHPNLPKLLSIFYDDNGKLKRVSYVIQNSDKITLHHILSDLQSLFRIKPRRDDVTNFEYDLYDFDGKCIKNKSDLYTHSENTFHLQNRERENQLPRLNFQLENKKSIIVNEKSIIQRRHSVSSMKLPNVHRSRTMKRRKSGLRRNKTVPDLDRRRMKEIRKKTPRNSNGRHQEKENVQIIRNQENGNQKLENVNLEHNGNIGKSSETETVQKQKGSIDNGEEKQKPAQNRQKLIEDEKGQFEVPKNEQPIEILNKSNGKGGRERNRIRSIVDNNSHRKNSIPLNSWYIPMSGWDKGKGKSEDSRRIQK